MLKTSPDIYLYNPTCDFAVGNGNVSWQPNRLLQKMESDMATLPLFFATENDVVIVPQLPSPDFLEHIQQLGIKLPTFSTKESLFCNSAQSVGQLKPWGWSPAAHNYFAPLKNSCSANFKTSLVFNWNNRQRELYSRKFAKEILSELMRNFPSDIFIDSDYLPEICTDKACFEKLIDKWGSIMVKAPWSSSGRGLQPVRKTPVHPKVWEKLLGIINTQGYALAEPYLNKVADLAFQFKIEKGEITYEGISNFFTDDKGQYAGNALNGLPKKYTSETVNFINALPDKVVPALSAVLQKSKLTALYEGYFGVDSLIFRDANNELKVNPCLEINLRYNMGLLSVVLEKYIHLEKTGVFQTFYKPGTSFKTFCLQMIKEHSFEIDNNKIKSGFFAVTEMRDDSLFGAYILV